MKAKSILATLLVVAGLQTQAQRVVLNFLNGNTVQYNMTELQDIQFVEITAIDGHEYIDLGLPSGTLWATTNIGAETPEDYGNYYAWGETEPTNTIGYWETYKFFGGYDDITVEPMFTRYYDGDINTYLLPEDDAATANWGSNWQMPSNEQIRELIDEANTTSVWVSQSGVSGLLVTSKSNGSSIFLPAAGSCSQVAGNRGYYWSRSVPSYYELSGVGGAKLLEFHSSGAYLSEEWRYVGCCVRPVRYQETPYLWPVKSIALSETEIGLEPSATRQLNANVQPSYAINKVLAWESSDETVATVDATGLVTAVKPGTCTITCRATDGSGVFATCNVNVFIDNSGSINGRNYVDLGLPSGTLWATCNVGANAPEEYGDYFAWGETTQKGYYELETYAYNNGSHDELALTKYCYQSDYGYNGFTDMLTELLPEDDAATVNWGSDWQMPSYDQITELYNSEYTTTEWTTQNDVNGRKITSKLNGNSIFLPAAGGWFLGQYMPLHKGTEGNYWSRSIDTWMHSSFASQLGFDSSKITMYQASRCLGMSVRPVLVKDEHEYVEIGGLKWATMNVGATTVAGSYETCCGDYFAWGETEPRYETMTRTAANNVTFTWKEDYSAGYDEPYPDYIDDTLDAAHDAATAAWGGTWRTPTNAEFTSLVKACTGSDGDYQFPVELTSTITEGGIYWLSAEQTIEPTYTGIAGMLFVSASDINKRVFFPTCGLINGNTKLNLGRTHGEYWSSSLVTSDNDNYTAYCISFASSFLKLSGDNSHRCLGQCVRPVSE